MSFVALLPARATSSRLPNKPLLDIAGKPMIVRVAEAAARSGAARVVVATDTQAIAQAVRAHGFEAVLTAPDHPTGTDRLSEAAALLGLSDETIVVNVQGDEPLIDPALIDAIATLLAGQPEAAIATCALPITEARVLFDPNVVKVVCGLSAAGDPRALYFSRAPIPWAREALAASGGQPVLAANLPAWQHLGLYAYRVSFLRAYPGLAQGALERVELLEQLRALEHGYAILVHLAACSPAHGVDTPEDLERVRRLYQERSQALRHP